MSTTSTFLIVLAIVLPLIICMVYIHRYIHLHVQPDLARLRVLRGLLGFVAALIAAYLIAMVILLVKGSHSHSTSGSLLTLVSFALVVTGLTVEIQRCQKRLKKP